MVVRERLRRLRCAMAHQAAGLADAHADVDRPVMAPVPHALTEGTDCAAASVSPHSISDTRIPPEVRGGMAGALLEYRRLPGIAASTANGQTR